MRGGTAARRIARRHHTRWLVINPSCPGTTTRPPAFAQPVYVSRRLVVFELR
jgi:hypothetical protein